MTAEVTPAIKLPEREAATEGATATTTAASMTVEGLSAWYGPRQAIRGIGLAIAAGQVTAIIGPSGCGKSTLIRCLNRLHEVVPGARVEGRVLLNDEDIYAPGVDPVLAPLGSAGFSRGVAPKPAMRR